MRKENSTPKIWNLGPGSTFMVENKNRQKSYYWPFAYLWIQNSCDPKTNPINSHSQSSNYRLRIVLWKIHSTLLWVSAQSTNKMDLNKSIQIFHNTTALGLKTNKKRQKSYYWIFAFLTTPLSNSSAMTSGVIKQYYYSC